MTTHDGTAGAAAAPAVAAPAVAASDIDGPEIVRVVRGEPDAVELAALLAVLSATATDDESAEAVAPPQTWAAYWRGVRQPLHPGPDGWRGSARPR